MPKTPKKRWNPRTLTDRAAALAISIAGVAVILAMLAMLILIVREALPLFLPATSGTVASSRLPDNVRAGQVKAITVASDLHMRVQVAGVILESGDAGFITYANGGGGEFVPARLPNAPDSAGISAAEALGGGRFSLLWNDGRLTLAAMTAEFGDGNGTPAAPAFKTLLAVELDRSAGTPIYAALRGDETSNTAVAVYSDGSIHQQSLHPGKGLRAHGKGVRSERKGRIALSSAIASAALNAAGDQLYLGSETGDIVSVDLSGDAAGDFAQAVTPAFRDRRALTALSFLNGDYALAVGDARGEVSVWFPRREGGEFRLRPSMQWPAQGDAIKAVEPSRRDRGFVTLASDGSLRWLYSTNGRELLHMPRGNSPTIRIALGDRADCLLRLHEDGVLAVERLDGGFPEAGWSGFFRKLLYEGYDEPAYVWQSTGSDASEPKLSLVPLIWGSVKAALYALIFATPISLAAAMYLSQFAAPAWRQRLKPAVEMLAAVPSVVIGFLAALWLAPLLESHLRPLIGDIPYDQRNSLVIAVAMGFAVIPTIFSLAEDAISSVPPSLSAASLALGASKWQTVCRVVLPTASPGIFTAVMLGLGRAVGETMIVLMAAGNTPIISLSPFNGMRTLSANIAVELPEAPVDGTLYRTLFLCALILFLLTLVINTAAEFFRHRLRRRYGRI